MYFGSFSARDWESSGNFISKKELASKSAFAFSLARAA